MTEARGDRGDPGKVPLVRIHYHRLPDREEVFEQWLVAEDEGALVTLATDLVLTRPVRIDGTTVLETGSDAVWFTFPGAWHDIGRFHTADGVFQGIYANILTPPALGADHRWETTDLFLDLWMPRVGAARVLDQDQFDRAAEAGWLDARTAGRARRELETLLAGLERGTWPPPVVRRWTRRRARDVLGGSDPTGRPASPPEAEDPQSSSRR